MRELQHATQVMIPWMLALLSEFVEHVQRGVIAMPTPTFVGIISVAFLLGLLLGRMSKHAVRDASEDSFKGAPSRVVLDLERLTPLGMSAEEETESQAMDISALRHDEAGGKAARSDERDQLEPPASHDRS